MFSYGDIKINVCHGVYSPREDSELLADAVRGYSSGKVLDLGTGSGIQGIVAAKNGCEVVFSDIDPKALKCAETNSLANGVKGRFIQSDLFSEIHKKGNHVFYIKYFRLVVDNGEENNSKGFFKLGMFEEVVDHDMLIGVPLEFYYYSQPFPVRFVPQVGYAFDLFFLNKLGYSFQYL